MRIGTFIFLLILIGSGQSARTAEVADDPSLQGSIQSWIADWDKPSFAARNAASQQLRDAGKNAFPALVEAAKQGRSETVSRALALLKSSLYAYDSQTQTAARKSLDQIAAGANSSAARSAQLILANFDRPPSQLANQQLENAWRVAGLIPQAARRINSWTFNGTTTIEAFENDGKIKIQQDAIGRIKVEITQKRQGGEVTEKFDAATLRELRTKHPIAHQAYQKYELALQQARMVVPRGFGIGAAPLPAFPQQPWNRDARAQLQAHQTQIELLQRLITQAPNQDVAESLNRTLRRTIESRDRLQAESARNR